MTIGSIAPQELATVSSTAFRREWDSPIPYSPTPLIGRRAELESAVAALRRRSTRLLTLTGPGGIGKTRLATEIAIALERDFRDGVVWVSLAPIRDPDAVISTIAASLGITGVDVSERLMRALHDGELLLVLDNFEQVLDASPQIGELLATCRLLQVVATSRARLHIRGERVLPVPPLSQRYEPERLARARGKSPSLAP